MSLKEIFTGGSKEQVVAQEIYQPPYRGNSPGMPPAVIIGPVRGQAEKWGAQIKGKIVVIFTGNHQEIEAQKEAYLRDRYLII